MIEEKNDWFALKLIGVGGISGCGKSTCAHRVVAKLNSPFFPITIDDFFIIAEEERRGRTLGVSSVSHQEGWCTSLEDVRAIDWEGYMRTVQLAQEAVQGFLRTVTPSRTSPKITLEGNNDVSDINVNIAGLDHNSENEANNVWLSYVGERFPELLRYSRPFDWKACIEWRETRRKHSHGECSADARAACDDEGPFVPEAYPRGKPSSEGEGHQNDSEKESFTDAISEDHSYADHLAYDEECREETFQVPPLANEQNEEGNSITNRGFNNKNCCDPYSSVAKVKSAEEDGVANSERNKNYSTTSSSTHRIADVFLVFEGFVLLSYPPLRHFFHFFIYVDCSEEVGCLRRFFRTPRRKPLDTAVTPQAGGDAITNGMPTAVAHTGGTSSPHRSVVAVIPESRLRYIFHRLYRSRGVRQDFHRDVALQWWLKILDVMEKEELCNEVNPRPSPDWICAARKHVSLWLSDQYFFYPPTLPSFVTGLSSPQSAPSAAPVELGSTKAHKDRSDDLSDDRITNNCCFCTFGHLSPEEQMEILNETQGEKGAGRRHIPSLEKCCCAAFEQFWGMDKWMRSKSVEQSILDIFHSCYNARQAGSASAERNSDHTKVEVDVLFHQLHDNLERLMRSDPSPDQPVLWGALEMEDIPLILSMVLSKVMMELCTAEERLCASKDAGATRASDQFFLRSVWDCVSAYAVFRFWYFYEVMYYSRLQQPIWLYSAIRDPSSPSSIKWCEEEEWRSDPVDTAGYAAMAHPRGPQSGSKNTTLWIRLNNSVNSTHCSGNILISLDNERELLNEKLSQLCSFICECC